MRYTNSVTLGEAIDKMVKELRLKPRMDEMRIKQGWERIMGKPIARYTSNLSLKGGKLYVKIDNAPLKQELTYGKEKIRDILNKEFSAEVVKEVIVY